MTPYQPLQPIVKDKETVRQSKAFPVPVPSLNDVQPFLPEPDFVAEDPCGLAPHFVQDAKHGTLRLLSGSYNLESSQSPYCTNLKAQVQRALSSTWSFDPVQYSVEAARNAYRDYPDNPGHSFTTQELYWITSLKLTSVKEAQAQAEVDLKTASEHLQWLKDLEYDDQILNIDNTLDQECKEFYHAVDISSCSIECAGDEGFWEPSINTTWVSLPDKHCAQDASAKTGIFQDSGICMDTGYAQAALPDTPLHVAFEITEPASKNQVQEPPSSVPTFYARVAPLRTPKASGPWLGLVGDQKQGGWATRKEAPYDFSSFCSTGGDDLESSDVMELNTEPCVVNESKSPHLAVDDTGGPGNIRIMPEKVTTQAKFQDQNKDSRVAFTSGNCPRAAQGPILTHASSDLFSDFVNFDGGGDNNLRDTLAITNVAQTAKATTHTAVSLIVPTAVLTTPVNNRVRNLRVAIPVSPTLNLTPEYDSDSDRAGEANEHSNHNRDVGASSPSNETQRGQGALSRYVEETHATPSMTRQSSSITISNNGSDAHNSITGALQGRSLLGQYVQNIVSLPISPSNTHNNKNQKPSADSLSDPEDMALTPVQDYFPPLQQPTEANKATYSTDPPTIPPTTPRNAQTPSTFRPQTPFQLGSPARFISSPATPTPGPGRSEPRSPPKKTTRGTIFPKDKRKANSVKSVFSSPKLGSRSPEKNSSVERGFVNATPESMARDPEDKSCAAPGQFAETTLKTGNTIPESTSAAVETVSPSQELQAVVVPEPQRDVNREDVGTETVHQTTTTPTPTPKKRGRKRKETQAALAMEAVEKKPRMGWGSILRKM